MPFDCKVGDTAFILDGGGGHKYVVLTNPNTDGKVVRVNFTTSINRADGGKLYTPSDDKDLFQFPSIVPYKLAELYPCDVLREQANRKDVVNHYKPCPQDIMKQIIQDAFESQFTKSDVIEELRVSYPNEYDQYYKDSDTESA